MMNTRLIGMVSESKKLENGRIQESGNHRDLLSRKETYARLWNVQQDLEQYGKGHGIAGTFYCF